MTTPTDLRAALRDAAAALTSEAANKRATIHADVFGDALPSRYDEIAARCRALADAPPTVAELLPMVDATHEVRWEAHGEERRIYAPDGGTLATEYRTSRTRWTETRLTVFDLRRPARLVEVSP
jgi:hypothetical protein